MFIGLAQGYGCKNVFNELSLDNSKLISNNFTNKSLYCQNYVQDIIFSLIGPDLVTKFVIAITIKLKKVDWFKLVAALKAT